MRMGACVASHCRWHCRCTHRLALLLLSPSLVVADSTRTGAQGQVGQTVRDGAAMTRQGDGTRWVGQMARDGMRTGA